MEKYCTELLVLETCSTSSRPVATDSLVKTAGVWARHLSAPTSGVGTAGVVKAGVQVPFQGTGMPFAGGTTPRVRITPSGTTVCDPPV